MSNVVLGQCEVTDAPATSPPRRIFRRCVASDRDDRSAAPCFAGSVSTDANPLARSDNRPAFQPLISALFILLQRAHPHRQPEKNETDGPANKDSIFKGLSLS
jgi:hypothetical protein